MQPLDLKSSRSQRKQIKYLPVLWSIVTSFGHDSRTETIVFRSEPSMPATSIRGRSPQSVNTICLLGKDMLNAGNLVIKGLPKWLKFAAGLYCWTIRELLLFYTFTSTTLVQCLILSCSFKLQLQLTLASLLWVSLRLRRLPRGTLEAAKTLNCLLLSTFYF